MSLPKFRRFYFPGLITLIFFPVIVVGYFLYEGIFSRLYVMRVYRIDDTPAGRSFGYNALKYRKFKDEVLNGNDNHDAKVLEDFTNNLAAFKSSGDTTIGYSVSFTNKTRYDEMVGVWAIANQPGLGEVGAVLYKNKVMVWKATPQTFTKLPTGQLDMYPVRYKDGQLAVSPFEQFKTRVKRFQNNFGAFWPSMIPLAGMIGFAFSKRRNYFSLKTFRFSDGDATV